MGKKMLVDAGMLAAVAALFALAGFIVKALDFENETAFKALNLIAAVLFAISFFLENAIIAMAISLAWALLSVIFIIRGPASEGPLRGWNENLWPSSGKTPPAKKKKRPRPKKAEQPSNEADSGKIWPWS